MTLTFGPNVIAVIWILLFTPIDTPCVKYEHPRSKNERDVCLMSHKIDFDRFKVYLTLTLTPRTISYLKDLISSTFHRQSLWQV